MLVANHASSAVMTQQHQASLDDFPVPPPPPPLPGGDDPVTVSEPSARKLTAVEEEDRIEDPLDRSGVAGGLYNPGRGKPGRLVMDRGGGGRSVSEAADASSSSVRFHTKKPSPVSLYYTSSYHTRKYRTQTVH